MFQLFKKSKAAAKEVTIDQQIYNDVYSAQELLLEEAKQILSAPVDFDDEKYQRLKKLSELGFSKAEDVRAYQKMRDDIEKSEKNKKLIEEYSFHYPLNKFITEDAIERICEKYGLLLAAANDYIAEIPEENQMHIINFKVRTMDIIPPIDAYWYQHSLKMEQTYPIHADLARQKSLLMEGKSVEEYMNERVQGINLKIVAPEHKLDMRYKEKSGYKVMIKDPIVLQPVNGGYLIVTSWGLEASDEAVVNGRQS